MNTAKKATKAKKFKEYVNPPALVDTDKIIEDAFKEAVHAPVAMHGPHVTKHDSKEFKLNVDPYLEKINMEGRISQWVADIAHVLGKHASGVAVVMPTRVLLAADDLSLLCVVLDDYLIEQVFPRLPSWMVSFLTNRLASVEKALYNRGHLFTILQQTERY